MSMVIRSNTSAMLALHQANTNISKLGKSLRELSSGQKINSAGDGASEYAISEKMRVRLRAMNQNDVNVRNGGSLLQVAAGAIQQQINLLREVKAKVINAHNDTNTDIDRATIQKEIDQYYDQIDNIAYETTYNGRTMLCGGVVYDEVDSWEIKDRAEFVRGSAEAEFIPGATISLLDGVEGPFDVFSEWMETDSSVRMTGGTEGTPKSFSIDLSEKYSTFADFTQVLDNGEGLGFSLSYYNQLQEALITGKNYVLTTDPTKNYRNAEKIDVSGCGSLADVANKIAEVTYPYTTASASGTKITFTSTEKSKASERCIITGYRRDGETVTVQEVTGADPTGLFSTEHFSGGVDGHTRNPDDPDDTDIPATYAMLSKDISSAAAGSGFTVYNDDYHGTTKISLLDDSSGLLYDSALGHYTLGKNATLNGVILPGSNIKISANGSGTLTFAAPAAGSVYNHYCWVKDGIEEIPPGSATSYEKVNPFGGTVTTETIATDGATAAYAIDLSAYDTTDADKMEELIDAWVGKALRYKYGSEVFGKTALYEFIDSADERSIDSVRKIDGRDDAYLGTNAAIDLNNIRSKVAGGQTVAEAFADLLGTCKNSSVVMSGGKVNGVRINTYLPGIKGNGHYMVEKEGRLRSYTVDFGAWFGNHSDVGDLAAYLDGKGFRAYCATCDNHWFNFVFSDGEIDADRPKSGTADQEIKTLNIDVSEVTDAKSLVRAIYDQAMPQLTGADEGLNHNMLLAIDEEDGKLILYDKRAYSVVDVGHYQERGAKIADGVFDNVIRGKRNIYCDDLIIQHTDKASKNIHLQIPRTTIDHVLGYSRSDHKAGEYNVMTSEMRVRLLGTKETEGIIDKGIQYLTDASTLVGAQINHMEFADANIITEKENTQASESVIRDADMAKSVMEYTKYNVLTQAAQAMLAQANQNSSIVLSLLQ